MAEIEKKSTAQKELTAAKTAPVYYLPEPFD